MRKFIITNQDDDKVDGKNLFLKHNIIIWFDDLAYVWKLKLSKCLYCGCSCVYIYMRYYKRSRSSIYRVSNFSSKDKIT